MPLFRLADRRPFPLHELVRSPSAGGWQGLADTGPYSRGPPRPRWSVRRARRNERI